MAGVVHGGQHSIASSQVVGNKSLGWIISAASTLQKATATLGCLAKIKSNVYQPALRNDAIVIGNRDHRTIGFAETFAQRPILCLLSRFSGTSSRC